MLQIFLTITQSGDTSKARSRPPGLTGETGGAYLRAASAICVLAFAAVAAAAMLGTSSASATALCKVKENPCPFESDYASGT
jgi:hypothetical protein